MNIQEFEEQLQIQMMMSPDFFPEKYRVENNKDGNSLWVCNMLLLRHKSSRDEILLSIPNRFLKILGLESHVLNKRAEPNFVYIPFSKETISIIMSRAVDIYNHCFLIEPIELIGCCSKYIKCSDERHCIQTMVELRQGCQYKRLNLDKGRIFYGVNRSI